MSSDNLLESRLEETMMWTTLRIMLAENVRLNQELTSFLDANWSRLGGPRSIEIQTLRNRIRELEKILDRSDR